MTQVPAEPTLLPSGTPSEAPSAKRGSLFGGAATEEALASSRKVLSQARGSEAFTGLQQYFTPTVAADFIAEVIGQPAAVLDPTAGSGSLLAPFAPSTRFGIEIDADHAGGSELAGTEYEAVAGDAQEVIPMLRAAGLTWPAVVLNPPFGLPLARRRPFRKGDLLDDPLVSLGSGPALPFRPGRAPLWYGPACARSYRPPRFARDLRHSRRGRTSLRRRLLAGLRSLLSLPRQPRPQTRLPDGQSLTPLRPGGRALTPRRTHPGSPGPGLLLPGKRPAPSALSTWRSLSPLRVRSTLVG